MSGRGTKPGQDELEEGGEVTYVALGVDALHETIAFLQRIPLFEGLMADHLGSLAELMVERTYKRGSAIFHEEDVGDALYIVRSGKVKIYRVAEDGREKTLAILGEGEFFGEMALLDGGPRSAIAEALSTTQLLALYRADFQEFVASNPAVALGMIKVLSMRLRQANAQVMDAIFRDVRGRVSRTLLALAARYGTDVPGGQKIDVKLTHQELANLVGTARETVSRILAEMQDAGLVRVEGRNLILVDSQQLEGYAAGL